MKFTFTDQGNEAAQLAALAEHYNKGDFEKFTDTFIMHARPICAWDDLAEDWLLAYEEIANPLNDTVSGLERIKNGLADYSQVIANESDQNAASTRAALTPFTTHGSPALFNRIHALQEKTKAHSAGNRYFIIIEAGAGDDKSERYYYPTLRELAQALVDNGPKLLREQIQAADRTR